MTLIFSAQGPAVNFFSASDLIISRFGHENAPMQLPLMHRRGNKTAPVSFAGLCQKAVVANHTQIQWAGREYVAKAIVQALMAASDDGREFVDCPTVIKQLGLTNEETANVSIIYHYSLETQIKRYKTN